MKARAAGSAHRDAAFAAIVLALTRRPGFIPLMAFTYLLYGAYSPWAVLSARVQPLSDKTLEAEIRELARRASIRLDRIFVLPVRKVTSIENAYLRGTGPTRRIVLFDSIVADPYDIRMVRQVAAHELGHAWAGDVWKRAAASSLILAAGTYGSTLALRSQGIRDPTRLLGPGDPLAAPFILAVLGLLMFLTRPLVAASRRRREGDADRFAIALTGDLDGFVETIHRLTVNSVDDPRGGGLLNAWFASHPPSDQRIAGGRAYAAELATMQQGT